jgi:hypothetical protein
VYGSTLLMLLKLALYRRAFDASTHLHMQQQQQQHAKAIAAADTLCTHLHV